MADIKELLGKTVTLISGMEAGSDRVVFKTNDGESFVMHHIQDCCEGVSIDDVIGDPSDLLDHPITHVSESSNSDNPKDDHDESFTWTFYHLATVKGWVTIRWYGSSNGYYSESVDFEKL